MGVKGYYFTFDALVGITLMLVFLTILPVLHVGNLDKEHLNAYSEDILKIFSSVKVNEIDNDYISYLIGSGKIKNANLTILEILGEFWANGDDYTAEQLVLNLTSGLVPQNYNLAFAVGNDLLSTSNSSMSNNLVSYSRFVSGIVEGNSSLGYISRVALIGFDAYSTYFTHENFIFLSEVDSDSPNPVDFSSGINSSNNTFGPYAGDDGWDWASGIYNNTSPMVFNGVVNGKLEMFADEKSDRSGAYGVQFYIDNGTYSSISNKDVQLSFYYEWVGNPDENFEPADEVWIKARFYSPFSSYHILGSDLDSGHQGSDPDLEVYAINDPDIEFNDTFVQNVTLWIEGPGWYYLDFGGKTKVGGDHEWGYFRFDNISLSWPDFSMNLTSNYSMVYGKANGCAWYLNFEDFSNLTLLVPSNYSGSNSCSYYANATIYSPNSAEQDSINQAVDQLLRQLDFDQDSLIDVNLGNDNVSLDTVTLLDVPYMWGPTLVEVRTWQ